MKIFYNSYINTDVVIVQKDNGDAEMTCKLLLIAYAKVTFCVQRLMNINVGLAFFNSVKVTFVFFTCISRILFVLCYALLLHSSFIHKRPMLQQYAQP